MQIFTVRKRKLRKGNVFTPVCPSFCSRGGRCALPPLGRHPLDKHPPWADTPRQTATAADGTHPTGMHSCFPVYFSNLLLNFVTEFVFLRKGDLGGFSINYRLANQTVHLQGQETTITGWRISDEKVENLIALLLL